jgi:hypothetical protein
MSMTDVDPRLGETPERDEFEEAATYRALSRPAVMSLVLVFLSLGAYLFPTLLILAGLGIVLGLVALRSIRRYPDEWSGRTIAWLGVLGCSAILVSATALHAAIYAFEVPEGYTRISFYDLQPVDEHPELPVPPQALELDGQRVFVKGFVYPDGQQNNIQKFVLVPDRGTCCFGGQPKLTDMIEVTLKGSDRIRYSFQMRKLAGTLHVDTRLKPVSGLGGVYYRLDADHVR